MNAANGGKMMATMMRRMSDPFMFERYAFEVSERRESFGGVSNPALNGTGTIGHCVKMYLHTYTAKQSSKTKARNYLRRVNTRNMDKGTGGIYGHRPTDQAEPERTGRVQMSEQQ